MWKDYKLGELLQVKHGYAFKSEFFASDGHYILLTPGNVYRRGGLKLKGKKEKYFVGEYPPEYLLSKDDLVLVMTDLTQDASILGGAFMVDQNDKYLHNQRLGLVSHSDEVDRTFLFYYLNWQYFRDQVKASSNGATVKHTSPKRIYKCSIQLPPKQTQQKIGAVLSSYDKLIRTNNRRINRLSNLAEEVNKEWFVRMRFPGHKDVPVEKGCPEGWREVTIGDVCKVARGSSPRPKHDGRFFDGGEIPWVKIADATASTMYVFRTKEHINEFGATFSRRLEPGSLIIATSGTLGFSVFLGVESCVHDGWIYLSEYEFGLKPVFFFYVINALREYLNNLSYGAAIQNVNTDIIRRLPFRLPPQNVLKQFYDFVEPIHEQIQVLSRANLQLREKQDLLSTRLLSGTLSVEGLNIVIEQNEDADGSVTDEELVHA